MTGRRSARFNRRDLIKIADASDFQDEREPDLAIGDLVRLNSGGPVSLVVDRIGGEVTAAWRHDDGTIKEMALPRECFHRCRDAW